MPKLWTETIDTHRHAVRDATLDATAALVSELGLPSVTMSQIAERAGIGRATLYKYFPDLQAILLAWHERQVTSHLHELAAVRDRGGSPGQRLQAVLETYARLAHHDHGSDLGALLHQGPHVAQAHQHLHALVRDLISEGARAGELRTDVPSSELAHYCLHALNAAGNLTSKTAVNRLVAVTLNGLQNPSAARPR